MQWFRSRRQPHRLSSEQGSEVAEAAVVLPILFLVLFSVYWFGQAFNTYGTINHAARQGARTAAVPGCASCGASCNWMGTNLPCDAQVADAVGDALVAAHLDPTQAQPLVPSPPPAPCPGAVPPGVCTTASGLYICRNVALDPSSGSPQVCGVIVSFQYPYQLSLPFSSLGSQPILLNGVAEMQGEQ